MMEHAARHMQRNMHDQQRQRGGRVFYIVSFAFCTAAILTGICFIYAVQIGLETLALYHPLPQKDIIMGSFPQGHFSRASLTRFEVSNGKQVLQPHKVRSQGNEAPEKVQVAFLPVETSGYNLGPSLPEAQQPLPWQQEQESLGAAYSGGARLSKDDFVAAIVTDKWHEELAQSSRLWRQGLRTFLATNYSMSEEHLDRNAKHGETWHAYPDDKPLHSLALKGDSRAALVPFLAHRYYGESYKWLLYGDDDTFFFLDAAMDLLQHLDPDMPYFLTDHMWWTSREFDEIQGHERSDTHHPHAAAPLCTPCNYGRNTSGLPFPSPNGCPCTPELLCSADTKGVLFKGARGKCGQPRVPTHTFSMHGGAGAILSVGLLRRIPAGWFEDCVTTTYSTGGDAFISICLWAAGYGMTAPDPLWHPRGLTMFDVGRIAQRDDEPIQPKVAHVMGNLLQAAAGGCLKGACRLELDRFLTLHLRSRKFPSIAAYIETVRVLAELSDRVAGRPSPRLPRPKDAFVDELVELGIQALQDRHWLTAQRPSNASTSQLADIVTTIRDEAEHKAASAVAAEIIAAVFERNPTDDPPPAYFGAAGAPDPSQLAEEGKKIAQAAGLQADETEAEEGGKEIGNGRIEPVEPIAEAVQGEE